MPSRTIANSDEAVSCDGSLNVGLTIPGSNPIHYSRSLTPRQLVALVKPVDEEYGEVV
jgi:hypothetical protein